MLIIGEKINVMGQKIGEAMRGRDAKPIQDLAVAQVEAGADMLDINLGPATKGGPELMEWVVGTVQEVVDVPLCLDTVNAEAMEAGLKVCKKRAMLNSISGERARIDKMMPLVKKYDTDVIGLTLSEGGIPRDANERMAIAVDLMGALAEFDVPLERLYLDPLILPIGVAQNQAKEVIEAVKMFKQLNDPPLKTVVGLSNIHNSCPKEVHSAMATTFLVMLAAVGLDAAIMNAQDKMQVDAVRTIRVIENDMLYCHSYLD